MSIMKDIYILLYARRADLLPHGNQEPKPHSLRRGLRHMENRGQEGGEAHGLCHVEVHHPRRQATHCGAL